MFQNHATLAQIRFLIQSELQGDYSENESSSMARLILEHVGYPSSAYLLDPGTRPPEAIKSQITEIVSEIHSGRPIQYVLGYTYFNDLKLSVNESVLIPRPETEEMVFHINAASHSPFRRILDLGTGSGCLALALKKSDPAAEVTGLDLSRDALRVARQNSQTNDLEIHWIQGNLLHPQSLSTAGKFDLVVSNPPYVLKSERKLMTKTVLEHEPGSALFVNDNEPLLYYHAIAAFCRDGLESGGMFWVEINERFGLETARLFRDAGFKEVSIIKDIHGKERYINGGK